MFNVRTKNRIISGFEMFDGKFMNVKKKGSYGSVALYLLAAFMLAGCAGFGRTIPVPSLLSQKTDTYIYYGGPFFVPDGTQSVTEVARYSATGQIAAITALKGNARILLIGFHPEVTSNSGLTSSDANRTWLNTQMTWALTGTDPVAPIAIYNESGEVWYPSVSGVQALCESSGLACKLVTASDLNTSTTSLSSYRAIIMPGGYMVGISVAGRNGQTAVNNLINSGGSYIGICSGAYAAASSVRWEGSWSSGLGFFHGKAVGSIYDIAAWPAEVLTQILH